MIQLTDKDIIEIKEHYRKENIKSGWVISLMALNFLGAMVILVLVAMGTN